MASIPMVSPSSQTSMRRARRMAGTGGSSSSCQLRGSAGSASGPGYAVFWLWTMEPSLRRALEPDWNPEQMSSIR